MLANVGHVPHHVFIERTARHAATIPIVAKRRQVFALGFNREFTHLLSRVSVAHHHSVHARTHDHVHDVHQVAFRQVRANLGIHGLANRLGIAVLHDFAEDAFGERQVHVHAGFTGIGAAQVNFDKVACLIGNSKTFKQVLQFFFVVSKARSFCHRHAHAKANLVSLHQLFVGAASNDFDTFVVETHAVVNGSIIF